MPPLRRGEVHVWRCAASPAADAAATALASLDRDERRLAARFRHEGARRRYVVARRALRTLAAAYLGADPGALRFATAPGGKPALAGEHAEAELRFNLSHSGDVVLLAFAREIEVGVDVETTARAVDWERLARRFLSPAEVTALHALPPRRRRLAFLVCWCCKEALAKVAGEGLMAALGGLEVPIPLGARPVALDGAACPARYLRRLFPGEGYAGALAAATRPRGVRCLEWRWPARPARALPRGPHSTSG